MKELTDTPIRNLRKSSLCEIMQSLKTSAECEAFLQDLCTPAELEALADRWHVAPLICDKIPYRKIHEMTGVSVTTIGRVARFIEQGNGGYKIALERLAQNKNKTQEES
ncbi:MAG: YerC/YecD family TrpR-related protein [bacterium]